MDMLQIKRNKIVDKQGRPVRLRGICVGGWMNMENFINGYPGVEHGIRSAMADVLGPNKAQFFFDRWLDYFLSEEDIAFIKQTGANVVRLALNYRHFENDCAPFEYLPSGFERLDRAVKWCAQHDLYVILDLHAVQGWQNPDWHSDNPNTTALFWEHPHFQDRWVRLWEELASRYVGNPTIAGYDVMNEPVSELLHGELRWEILNGAYRRVVTAIRAIDSDHIIFLEGDRYATRFNGMDAPFADNLAYSGHSYSPAALGPGTYPGIINGRQWDTSYMRKSHLRHQALHFAREHGIPLWIGEFGALCNGPTDEHTDRLAALNDQIQVFEEFGAHWTYWCYKDVGVMGWVTVNPESDYMQLVGPILQAKVELEADAWAGWLPTSRAGQLAGQLAEVIHKSIGDPEIKPELNLQNLKRAIFYGYAAALMQPAFAKCFKGMSEVQLDRVLQSFALKNCQLQQDLLGVMSMCMNNPA